MFKKEFNDIFDYTKLSILELVEKIGYSRYWDLPTMLKIVLRKLNGNLDLKEDKANKGIVNGYASLDSLGKVPSNQLPPDLVTSVNGQIGAVVITKAQVGLSNVDNTSDINKPISAAQIVINATKVDKVLGKGLSENDFTTVLKNAYDGVVSWISTNGANLINHITRTDNPHNVTKAQVGLSNVDNTSDINKPISTVTQTALDLKEDKANKNVVNGYAGLGTDGKLLSAQLPSITISDTFLTASQGAMLALVAQIGDISVRTDLNKSFILKGGDPTVLANWQELLTPTSAVTTVFGRNGGVTAQVGDYIADQITETATRVFQTPIQRTNNDATSSIQTQLNSKANTASPTFTGVASAPTAIVGTNTTQIATTAFVLANAGSSLPVSASQSGIVNNVSLQELGGVDKTINSVRVGRGSGNLASNTAIGSGALSANTAGIANTAIGVNALSSNTVGNVNAAFGFGALKANTTGVDNTATGSNALMSNTIGSSNTATGNNALLLNTTGSNNTATGNYSLSANTIGNQNVATGLNALKSNTIGSFNVATGFESLSANTTGSNNTATGTNALLSNTTGDNNTTTGFESLKANTTGFQNTATGTNALLSNTTGDNNTTTGFESLKANTTGFQNTASGARALNNNTSGFNNTASGASALDVNTTGNLNTAGGVSALQNNTVGSSNTASGVSALQNNTIGNSNTASGASALAGNTTGINNTASGVNALAGNTTGFNNIGIGYSSGIGINLGSNNTYIGQGTTLGNTSNTICLATGVTNRIIVDGSGKTNLLGMLSINTVPTFADNSLATSGGLIAGDVYRTALGVLMIRF